MFDVIIESAPVPVLHMLRAFKPSDDVRARIGSLLAMELPSSPSLCSRSGNARIHALGPSHWLLQNVAPTALNRLATDSPDGGVLDVTEVSAGYRAMVILGTQGRWLLAKGCTMDTDVRVFPIDACAGTLLAQVEVLLIRESDDRFLILFDRSFERHLTQWFGQSVRMGLPDALRPSPGP